ncbi:MAG: 3D-(3,5/4)-trihydroxycyclohexane-1,2-dione acylhydrolase (decyclizing) [Alphaproteobacteria bacterium]|nr:3D-(3,5/4)-trihydroxycyclohexane-1,2-dione acylhydrolase (decyclizing) [Alphaproteobacteria bacterium]
MRLTAAQALVRWLAAQHVEIDGREVPICAGMWAIFGHGNVAGLGEALHAAGSAMPTLRAHNEQAMALAAIAYAKASFRRRFMACTTSIGPGATNMVTAAAVAHVNRLPVLLIPGDVFANRRPDPVLQQIEDFGDPTISANDCFRPVSRYWDRITRPEQLMTTLPAALATLLDPVTCGPVTLGFCQDVQAEAALYPDAFFARHVHRIRRPAPDSFELEAAADALRTAKAPLIIAGGGVLYSGAAAGLAALAEATGIPVAETQAGKGALPWDHSNAVGSIGVTGSTAANTLAAEADVVLAIGTRLQDFTTGSRALLGAGRQRLVQLNVAAYDAQKHFALPLVGDAGAGIEALKAELARWKAPESWTVRARSLAGAWQSRVTAVTTASPGNAKPSDAQVLGAVNRFASSATTLVCAAGGLPGELHKLWRATGPGSYHLEYGYSCMGYEIAGGLGTKLARPQSEVVVMVGDGSYLMMNSEIATSVALGAKLIIVVLDNRGFGCINRLQQSVGGASFNNLFGEATPMPAIDFAAHARSLGATSEKVGSIAELPAALERARHSTATAVVVIDTEAAVSTGDGGTWWDVPVAATSGRAEVVAARERYDRAIVDRGDQRVG